MTEGRAILSSAVAGNGEYGAHLLRRLLSHRSDSTQRCDHSAPLTVTSPRQVQVGHYISRFGHAGRSEETKEQNARLRATRAVCRQVCILPGGEEPSYNASSTVCIHHQRKSQPPYLLLRPPLTFLTDGSSAALRGPSFLSPALPHLGRASLSLTLLSLSIERWRLRAGAPRRESGRPCSETRRPQAGGRSVLTWSTRPCEREVGACQGDWKGRQASVDSVRLRTGSESVSEQEG
jgi:hypothetical protein